MTTSTQKHWLIAASHLALGVIASNFSLAQTTHPETHNAASQVTGQEARNFGDNRADKQIAGNTLNQLDIITVIGTRNITDVAGSITYIAPEELAIQNYTDINRILRTVPGVNLQEEDGYGLFPNIGIRGSGTERSAKVLILEDGVPIAPAPFAAPAAYYFPSVGRINAVEVTKSVGAVKYGPITTGGTIQFFSTPIPTKTAASATILTSSLGRTTAHAWAGSRIESEALPFDVGFVLETYQENAEEGFKQIDIGSTGFSVEDYMAKLGFYSKDNARFDQSLTLKYLYSGRDADETYLGLTLEDFERTPFLRYRASQLDNFTSTQETLQATHNIALSDNIQLTTLAYRTDFARNWIKLDEFDNSQLSGLGACNSLNEILVTPTLCTQEFEVLVGADGFTSPDDVLGLRHNNRTYYAQGIQSALGFDFQTGGLEHYLVTSVRYHEDFVDRFQQTDRFRIDNGTLVRTTDNAPGTQANRLSSARSIALYVEDRITAGAWQVTAGLRYEEIDTDQVRWSTPDRNLAPSSIRENAFNEFLPSLGIIYDVNDKLSLLAGVARGFAIPGPSNRSADAERSVAYEFGGRYNNDLFSFEAIGFFNDYSNLIATCTNASGGSECDIGDSDNAGAANVFGLEITAATDLGGSFEHISLPLNLVYAYTNTELLSSVDSDIFGDVNVGDEIPYVPEHQITLSGGVIGEVWGVNASLNYVSQARDVPGQGPVAITERIDARTLVDVAVYYDLKAGIRLHLKADNVFDTVYLAGRRPYGVRPGKPREIFAGLSLDF
ncbi:MAG: TonB-dependent receptor [Robiginitomaculum sp.]|nr:TonB-dependent receptor [Robiginitomaculum sp.]